MKALNALIKLHKRALDDLRRKLMALETRKQELLNLFARLDQELKEEHDKAMQLAEMAGFFGNFNQRIRERQEKIMADVRELEAQMEQLRNEIAIKFGEVKKFEIARDQKLARQKEEQARKDTIALDEIAGQAFARKEREES